VRNSDNISLITADSLQLQMEQTWRRRAARLSQRAADAGAAVDTRRVIVLELGLERFGIDLSDIGEVLPPIHPTPVPGAAAVLAGVINVRGEIRPVIALRSLLGMVPQDDGGRIRGPSPVVVLRKPGCEMGIQIDGVEQILWIQSNDFRPVQASSLHSSPFIKGCTKDLLILLRTSALFGALEIDDLGTPNTRGEVTL
jgi:chemotaxis signal transduction protein